jgi:formate dehydrogenase iron-sulfur subunit
MSGRRSESRENGSVGPPRSLSGATSDTAQLCETGTCAPADPSRRRFFKLSGVALSALAASSATASEEREGLDDDRIGVLVDLTLCLGCRRCEWACNEANNQPSRPLQSFDDTSIMQERRQPQPVQLTVVNRAPPQGEGGKPLFFKVQCMHCEKPACVSACLVGAMHKHPDGPVTYDASKCIGCRYCMVACPHQLLAYEYDDPLTPRVRKCTLCRDRTKHGGVPACVEICPVEALRYGRRSDLLVMAHERIRRHPDRYVDHVYGETEAGGSSWLYLSDRPFTDLGFPSLGPESPAQLSEAIQHGIFKGFAAPLLLGGLLLTLKHLTSGGSPEPDPTEDPG